MKWTPAFFVSLAFLFSFTPDATADPLPACSSPLILQRIKKLNVLTRVLYIAAHPDDENNTLNAYFTNEQLFDVAYLSLTRGDGGQNLIGVEQQEALSVLRTEESRAAHKIDGARIFFTCARDFGFSKTAAETLRIWDKDKVLADMVWIIRQYRPDIIITRFSSSVPEAHGHHIASAILAHEAYIAAGDASRFPGQLKYTTTWRAKRLLWNAYGYFTSKGPAGTVSDKNLLAVHTGLYNPLLGETYTEIAGRSREMHRSQGMTAEADQENTIEYFRHIDGDSTSLSLSDGIEPGWNRCGEGHLSTAINKIIQSFDINKPAASLKDLVYLLRAFDRCSPSLWVTQKRQETIAIIRDILGLQLEATAAAPVYCPGEQTTVSTKVINRSDVPVELTQIRFVFAAKDTSLVAALRQGESLHFDIPLQFSSTLSSSQPYWLKTASSTGHFNFDKQDELLGEEKSDCEVAYTFRLWDYPFILSQSLSFRDSSHLAVKQHNDVAIVPDVWIDLSDPVYCFTSPAVRQIAVKVKAGRNNVEGKVQLQIPQGWKISPRQVSFHIDKKLGEQQVYFSLTPPANQQSAELKAEAIVDSRHFNKGYCFVQYPHINNRYFYPAAKSKLIRVEFRNLARKIAYLKGSGDIIDQALASTGLDVQVITTEDLTAKDLKQYDAVVLGIRAYNVWPALVKYKDALTRYVMAGGNVVALYNTCFNLATEEVGLLPLRLSAERITDETAVALFLNSSHRVLHTPNTITEKDFDGWVQDRGAYFPDWWDEHFTPVLSFTDPGEKPLNGGLLIARLGKGYFTYTSLSFFRQLPAGVPGAYRLFSNILSMTK